MVCNNELGISTTKLLEGNVLTCVGLLRGRGDGANERITHDALELTVQAHPPAPGGSARQIALIQVRYYHY